MDNASAQLLAVALAATWCGFGLYGIMRKIERSPQVREMLRRFRRARLSTKAAVVAGLIAVVAVGGTKPGGSGGGDPPRGLPPPAAPAVVEPAVAPVEVRTNGVALASESASAVEVADWRKHGSSSGGVWLDFDEPFFRIGTNDVSRVHVSASGVLSFESMRRPPVGAPLPDGSGLPALAPLLAPLGMVPEANWTNAGAASRFWHDAAPGRGRVFTWENALLDRLPGRRVSVQAELRPSGDFTVRYDFADALDPPATNLVLGAQVGTNGVNALAILGTNLLAETVWRVDGVRVTNGVSVADLLCTNGILRTPARFAIEWKNTSGIDPNADTDGDGLSDWDEVFRHGTDPNRADTDGDGLSDAAEHLTGANPLDADEDGDGVPDGVVPATWAANPLWGDIAGKTNLVLSLDADISTNGAATLLLGGLALPLRSTRSWALCIPEGSVTTFDLRTMNGALASLSLSEPATGAPDPIHLDDPDDVFRVVPSVPLRSTPPHPPSDGGSGHLCVLDVCFVNYDTGEPAPDNECIHDLSGVRRLAFHFADPIHNGMMPTSCSPAMSYGSEWMELSVSDQPGDSATASAAFELVCGSKTLTASIHRCSGGQLVWCAACGMYHDAIDPHACPHIDGCPTKTNDTAACTCPIPVIRVNGTGTSFSELALLDFPSEAECCCSRPGLFTYARLVRMDTNLTFDLKELPDYWVDPFQAPDYATVYATDESVGRPSEIEYEIVRRHYGGNGSATTNEVVGSGTLCVWATTIELEPITLVRENGRPVNPCGIVTNETAVFKIDVSPAAFPDSAIHWIADPVGRVRFVGEVDTGRRIEVVGVTPGDVTLSAYIDGYLGPPALVHARVMPRTTVPVYAWIVCDVNGVPAVEDAILQGKFPEINRIWDQVGITWQLAEVNFVTNQAWTRINDDTNRVTLHKSICSYGSVTNGVELYCVAMIEGAGGLTSTNGCVVQGNEPAVTYAHEFGHLCGLRDIYAMRPSKTNLAVSGLVEKDRLALDWSSDSYEGYYPPNLAQSTLIGRLLMQGRNPSTQCDISAGDIDGLWNHWRRDDETGTWGFHHDLGIVPVGFHLHGNKQPTTKP